MLSRFLRNPKTVFALIFFSYLIFLGHASAPLTGDQKVYLSIAIEMSDRNEWRVPFLFGEPNFLKPPFQYWMTMLGWKAFGFGMIGALIPSVVALMLSAFVSYQIAKTVRLKNPIVAPLVFSSTLGTLTYGTSAQMEIWVVAFYLLAWLWLIREQLVQAWMVAGVLAWIKGPLYSALFSISAVVRKTSLLREKKFWISLFIGMLIGLLWYGAAAITHSKDMIQQFFYQENFGKISTSHGSALHLWGEFLVSLCPWFPIVIVGAFQEHARKAWKKHRSLFVSFALVPCIFFTVFPYRVNSYLYLLTPVIAWMMGEVEFETMGKRVRTLLVFLYILIYTLSGLVLARIFEAQWVPHPLQPWIVLAFLGSVSLVGLSFLKRKTIIFSFSALLLILAIRLTGVGIGQTDLEGIHADRSKHSQGLVMWMNSKNIWHESGWLSTAVAEPIGIVQSRKEVDRILAEGKTIILQDDQASLVKPEYECRSWKRFNKRIHLPPIQYLFQEDVQADSAEYYRTYWLCSARRNGSK